MNFAAPLTSSLNNLVDATRLQPEFAAFEGIPVEVAEIPVPFEVTSQAGVRLGSGAFVTPALLGFHLRHALELAWLLGKYCPAGRAALAAARVAALFAAGETYSARDQARLPGWTATMRAEAAPNPASLTKAAGMLGVTADPADIAHIRSIWTAIGTAEAIMETGGDIRLARDPVSALNGYGSSHRPRPWAVTFASSTASSSSERGYMAADLARLRATAAMLTGPARAPVQALAAEIRAALARIYGLAEGSAVVLAASGTDTELLALAVTHLARPETPILNILVAPEETGSGVPMAARGLHFAVDTALGHDVSRAAPILGFRADTQLAQIPLREMNGTVRPPAAVEAEIAATVAEGVAAGRRVILHVLDLSKTGLRAPRLDLLRQLRAAQGAAFDIVVDACQARLSPASVALYLALDAVVLITGSKFFTGPPFAGAALIPPGIARRFDEAALPAGLDAYFGRDEFPHPCPAAEALPPVGNYGLALRWHAALAEMTALFAVPPGERLDILNGFATVVAEEIRLNPALTLLPAPAIARAASDEEWERCPSIFSFALAAPDDPGRYLAPDAARCVYHWLNTDLSAALPGLAPVDRDVAARICHIGQPVPLPRPDGGFIGVLRVSAGARLVSGEPSHRRFSTAARLAREFDDLRLVFRKIGLILRHFAALQSAGPRPRYR